MENNMKKIAIVGLSMDSNIGDPILCESTLFLCRQLSSNNSYKLLDLRGRTNKNLFWFFNLPLKLINFILFIFGKKTLHLNFANKRYLKNYISWNLKKTDLIVFAGGGIIETEHYCCNEYIKEYVAYATRHGIKIAFNSVGFNGSFNSSIKGYSQLREILNEKNVISITVRENLDEMNNRYLINKKATLVADTGVWSAECYGISKKNDADCIGIGVIRPHIFKEFNFNVSEENVISLYLEFIKILETKQKRWQLFTNGSKEDYAFGLKLLSYLNIYNTTSYLQRLPKTGKQFLSDLSSYRGIVCARMHASICSYSLGIPSVALLWNPKQTFFYQNIGYPLRCLNVKEQSGASLYAALDDAIQEGYNIEKQKEFKNSVKKTLMALLNGGIDE